MVRRFCLGILAGMLAATGHAAACDTPHQADALQGVARAIPASYAPAPSTKLYQPPSNRLDPYTALSKINELRLANGVKPLTLDPLLAEAAHAHAADLARRDAISHYGVNGSTPVTRVASTGYDAVLTGENVATGYRDFDEVLDGWLHSPGHRKTLLLPDVVHVGLALVYDRNASSRTFWTMVVAEPF
ncbi:MAG: CAP domain-containing protein [Pseudomonadota bacterium]